MTGLKKCLSFSKQFCDLLFHKVFPVILAGIFFLLPRTAFSAEIDLKSAEAVACNFLTHLGENYTISDTSPVDRFGQKVGYLVTLNPQGYILVAGDTIRVPIKAYSLTSKFDNLPPAYVQTLLTEMQIPEVKSASTRRVAAVPPEETNRSYWDFLTRTTMVSKRSARAYTPDTYLLSTQWDQGFPYNRLNPQAGEELTLTGCTQTALAQVMRYHAHPSSGSGVFNHNWNGQTLTAVMNRPFNWSAMPDRLNGSVEQYRQEEVAALMRDLGVLNQADFGTDGTSAWFNYNLFERVFGYDPISVMYSYSSGQTN
ncbi:MAG: hypothetical protein GY737_30000 [Desulfobacteraceae bacterium]|nr:hypothetical protein [Desulfobacteraceae bacterium]